MAPEYTPSGLKFVKVSKTASIQEQVKPFGLSVLHEPDSGAVANIIFVHGLGGSSVRTWSWNQDSSTFWPQKWLPMDPLFKNFRVWTYGYESNFMSKPATLLGITDFAQDLLHQMKDTLGYASTSGGPSAESRLPLIFVAHSMGGLVVKQALISAKQDSAYADMLASIQGIMFLATPHRGTSLAQTLNNIFKSSASIGSKAYITDLDKNSPAIQQINDSFRQRAGAMQFASMYETLPTSFGITKRIIVERSSAILGYSNEISAPLNAGHNAMCKFRSHEDPNYLIVRTALAQLVSGLVQEVPEISGQEFEETTTAEEEMESSPGPDWSLLNMHFGSRRSSRASSIGVPESSIHSLRTEDTDATSISDFNSTHGEPLDETSPSHRSWPAVRVENGDTEGSQSNLSRISRLVTIMLHPKSTVLNLFDDFVASVWNAKPTVGYSMFKWTCLHCRRTFRESVKGECLEAAKRWVVATNEAQEGGQGKQASTHASSQTPLNAANRSAKSQVDSRSTSTSSSTTLACSDPLSQSLTLESAHPELLMLCVVEDRNTTRLMPNDLRGRSNDREVFESIREKYNQIKKQSWLRLSVLSHIEWKQFHIYHSNRVAIDSHSGEDWPRCQRNSCKTGCTTATEYVYEPCPSALHPPIPRQAMMHFYQHPEHAGTKKFHRSRLPKRKQVLSLGADDSMQEGWGLVFRERISWEKVAAFEGVVGIASFVFAVVWSKTHDGNVSDAFAPSSWIVGLGAILLTLMYQREQGGDVQCASP